VRIWSVARIQELNRGFGTNEHHVSNEFESIGAPQVCGNENTGALLSSDVCRLNAPSEGALKEHSAHQESLCG
jgi:hypothetical protein